MAFSQSNSRGNSDGTHARNFLRAVLRRRSSLIFRLLLELQNRKILEELQLKKQMLLKQGVAPSLTSSLAVPSTGSASNIVSNDLRIVRCFALLTHALFLNAAYYAIQRWRGDERVPESGSAQCARGLVGLLRDAGLFLRKSDITGTS